MMSVACINANRFTYFHSFYQTNGINTSSLFFQGHLAFHDLIQSGPRLFDGTFTRLTKFEVESGTDKGSVKSIYHVTVTDVKF